MNGAQQRIEQRFRRILGPSEAERAEVNKRLAAKDDWYATCRKCGKRLTGTPDAIAAHVCEEAK